MNDSEANVYPVADPDRVSRDSLLEHWLDKPTRRAPSSRPPPRSERPTPVPIGDSVADDWFR